MRNFIVAVRFTKDEHEQIVSTARSHGISKTELLRTFILEGVSGYDRNFVALYDAIEKLTTLQKRTHGMAALSAVLAASSTLSAQSLHAMRETRSIVVDRVNACNEIAKELIKSHEGD